MASSKAPRPAIPPQVGFVAPDNLAGGEAEVAGIGG